MAKQVNGNTFILILDTFKTAFKSGVLNRKRDPEVIMSKREGGGKEGKGRNWKDGVW